MDDLDLNELIFLIDGIEPKKLEAVEARIEETLLFFENMYPITIERPTVVFDLKGHTAGWANYREWKIRLNRDLIANNETWPTILEQTVPHEVIHLVCYTLYRVGGHGWQWKHLMHEFGLPPDRTHDLPTTPVRRKSKPYEVFCNCDEPHMVTATIYRRMKQGQTYTCRKCKARLRYDRY